MRFVLWSMVLSSILLCLWAEVASPIVQKKHKESEWKLPVHITLYLEKSVFSLEKKYVSQATTEWSEATDGQVTFDLAELPAQDIDITKSIVLVNVTSDFPQIIVLDTFNNNNNSTLAYCDRNATLPHIDLVYDRINDEEFKPVIEHELGHYLGLEHPNTKEHPEWGLGTLMYSSLVHGADHITPEDLTQLCKLYHCDARKFHGFSEVQ